jgi:hypothetical protein
LKVILYYTLLQEYSEYAFGQRGRYSSRSISWTQLEGD